MGDEPEQVDPRVLEERFTEEKLARTASAKIGLGAMEAEMERARAEIEAEIMREEEEKAAKRAGRRTGAGFGAPQRKEIPVARPTSAGRRPGSGKRLTPLQQRPGEDLGQCLLLAGLTWLWRTGRCRQSNCRCVPCACAWVRGCVNWQGIDKCWSQDEGGAVATDQPRTAV